MKKTIMAAVFVLSFITAGAQVRYGVRAGVNFSGIPTKIEVNGSKVKADNVKGLTRLYAGALVDVPFTERWHLQAEADFAWMGCKVDEQKIKETQIQIPVMAKFYIMQGLPVLLGPYGSYSTSVKLDNDGTKVSLDDFYNKWDFGLQTGLAYEFNFGLFVEFRYVRGFVNIAKDNTSSDPDAQKLYMYNQAFQGGIGYRF